MVKTAAKPRKKFGFLTPISDILNFHRRKRVEVYSYNKELKYLGEFHDQVFDHQDKFSFFRQRDEVFKPNFRGQKKVTLRLIESLDDSIVT